MLPALGLALQNHAYSLEQTVKMSTATERVLQPLSDIRKVELERSLRNRDKKMLQNKQNSL